MATFYRGLRTVLKGRSTANAIDPYTGKVGAQGHYLDLNSPDHIFDGFPDTVRNIDVYDGVFGNARVDQNLFTPMENPGDKAGTALKSYDYQGVPSAPVLTGTTGWRTDTPVDFLFFGLATAAAIPTAGITNAANQINYYGDYVTQTPLANPGLAAGLDTDWDILEWKGTPSSKAL